MSNREESPGFYAWIEWSQVQRWYRIFVGIFPIYSYVFLLLFLVGCRAFTCSPRTKVELNNIVRNPLDFPFESNDLQFSADIVFSSDFFPYIRMFFSFLFFFLAKGVSHVRPMFTCFTCNGWVDWPNTFSYVLPLSKFSVKTLITCDAEYLKIY